MIQFSLGFRRLHNYLDNRPITWNSQSLLILRDIHPRTAARFVVAVGGRINRVTAGGYPKIVNIARGRLFPNSEPCYSEPCSMIHKLNADSHPLYEDAAGGLRVGNSRVLLELVVRAFDEGVTPEGIIQRYPTLLLVDVYAVVAYYLRHRTEIQEYLNRREAEAATISEKSQPYRRDVRELRSRLLKERGT